MKIGNEMRNGQVLCRLSKPIHRIRWRPISPAIINGVCGDSRIGTPHFGVCTDKASPTWTLSKLTKRKSGWADFQSTSAGVSILPIELNQFVPETLKVMTLTSGQTAG